jgi:hypothetical protein
LNLLFEKIVAHFDMQLSETYFKMYNPVYASRIKIHRAGTAAKINAEDAAYKPMFDIVHRSMVRLFCLSTRININLSYI